MAHVPRLYLPGRIAPGRAVLDGSAGKRVATVLRLREGDAVNLFAGDGKEWRACIEAVERQRVHVQVEELLRQGAPPSPQLEIAIAVVRANRMDWALEKCVEAGVDAVRPITTSFANRGNADSNTRRERWERIIVEASEQCGRLYLPQLLEPLGFDAWLSRSSGPRFFGDADGQRWEEARSLIPSSGKVSIAIGPEGGFAPEEVAALRSTGAIGIRLGPNILRSETAAVIATALVRSIGT